MIILLFSNELKISEVKSYVHKTPEENNHQYKVVDYRSDFISVLYDDYSDAA